MHRGRTKVAALLASTVGAAAVVGAFAAGPVNAAREQPASPGGEQTFGATRVTSMTSALNRAGADDVPDAVTQWGPSATYDRVVVHALPEGRNAAEAFVRRSGIDPDSVTYAVTRNRPRTYAELVGGEPYLVAGISRCSIGFSVEGGFVTAGHCGDAGDTTIGPDGTVQGRFEDSTFPGRDMARVSVTSDWTPTARIAGGDGPVSVHGSEEAAVGARVCRSGSTTGWRCGEIVAKDQTVSYPQGTVRGLTQTTVCAEPGDSGGPYVSDGQAQGVTSGGSGDCTSGGTTYFQPVDPILDEYELTLLTSG